MFIGHHDCPQEIKFSLYEIIENLITYENVMTFYVGTQGLFDRYVYDVLCQLERVYNIKIFVVLAYLSQNQKDRYYDRDKTLFPEILDRTPLRFAINKRNTYMIKQSQYMVCYVNNTFTNTYKFVSKAKSLGLKVFNLGQLKLEK